jgi:hypothetical protein
MTVFNEDHLSRRVEEIKSQMSGLIWIGDKALNNTFTEICVGFLYTALRSSRCFDTDFFLEVRDGCV